MQHPDIKQWKHRLQSGRQQLREIFEQNNQSEKLLRGHSRLVDAVLREIWEQSGLPAEFALIAVGGYGRSELFPQSDVDILILLPTETSPVQHAIESLVGILWDIGLAIGHSVRNLEECADEASRDITVQTNLLEARLLAGNRKLFNNLQHKIRQEIYPEAFFKGKMQEQLQRHRRFNDTSYNLEPNIKESPGGLRDLHMIRWIALAVGLPSSWRQLLKVGMLTKSEASQIRHHERQLNNFRIRLHYLANRREDRLLFDHQDALARQIIPPHKLAQAKRKRPSEQIMQRFYQSARTISLMNEILLGALKENWDAMQNKVEIQPVDAHFQIRNGLLDVRQPHLFETNPEQILNSFQILQQNTQIAGMSPSCMRALWLSRKRVNRDFRNNPVHHQAFLAMFRFSSGIASTMRRLHRYGILGNYIPAFGRITHQMQHDLFHVYTVDEHTLNVLGNMAGFADPERKHEFPLCSKLFADFEKPELLYLAALFHDIAKGRGGDHSRLGEIDARRFCKSHGLNKQDTALVSWLVRNHLILSATAQQQDTSDPEVIATFARAVGDEQHLTALYLLTVADVRGTSPAIWNAWKGRLFENLFQRTLGYLHAPDNTLDTEIRSRRQEALTILAHYAISATTASVVWEKLEDSYFLRHEAKEIAWQTRLLLTHINTTTPIVRARLSPAGDGIQIMIYAPDRDDLFARICGFFERMDHNIVEAKINTTRHGYALDSFLVLDRNDRSVRYGNLIAYIEANLTQKLTGDTPLEPPLNGRASRQLKHFPVETRVFIEPSPHKETHSLLSLVTGDNPGLLCRVAHIFLQHGIRLHTAKINTLGSRVEDSFLISSGIGNFLSPQVLLALEQDLIHSLEN